MKEQNPWFKIFKDLKERGKEVGPRGLKTLELEDYQVKFNIDNVICPFKERNLSLSYNFTELAWYLSGNRDDLRMELLSPFWKTVKNPFPPYYNSNYGHYWFKENQFEYVIEILKKDKDSRQACIMMNRKEVCMSDSNDKICTNSIMFRIRDNKLNMSVQMRSNDVITGLGIDSHMFSILWQFVYLKLKEQYQELEFGSYTHNASSFHIYEKHWGIMEKIIDSGGSNIIDYQIPKISIYEVSFLMKNFSFIEKEIREALKVSVYIPETFKFTNFAIKEINKRWNK